MAPTNWRATRAATTRARRSRIPATSGRWSSASAPPVSIAPPTGWSRRLRPAKACSILPPRVATTSAPSSPACSGCSSATAPPNCRRPSSRRWRAKCRIRTRFASPSNTVASNAAPPRRPPCRCLIMCGRAMSWCSRMTCKPTTGSRISPMNEPAHLRDRAKALLLHGLLAHWHEVAQQPWVATPIEWEEQERVRRSLERRLHDARIGRFKPLADFDWTWPTRCDRAAIEALMTLDFLSDATNVIFVGQNGTGKTMLAQNIAHQAVILGHSVLFTSAGQLLGDLAALDSDAALRRRLHHYARPALLVIDEVGYLSYSNRHADLMFELISRRYQNKSTLITTNRAFAEWRDVFPNAACVVSLVDRLVHRAEIVAIEGESYRAKEARERAEQRAKQRRRAKPLPPQNPT